MPTDVLRVHIKPNHFPRFLPPEWAWLDWDKNHRSLIVPFTEGFGGYANCLGGRSDLQFKPNNLVAPPQWARTASGIAFQAIDPAGPSNFSDWTMPAAEIGTWLRDASFARHGGRTWFAVIDYPASVLGAAKHTVMSVGSQTLLLNGATGTTEWHNHDILNADKIVAALPHGNTDIGEGPAVILGRASVSTTGSTQAGIQLWLGDATNPGPTGSTTSLGFTRNWSNQGLSIGRPFAPLKGQTDGFNGNIYLCGWSNFPWSDFQIEQLFRDPFGMLRRPVDLPESFPEGPDPGAVYADARERLYTGGPDCRLYTTDARERALTDEARARLYTDEAPERLTTDDARGAGKP